MNKIVVTGATGMIGSALIESALKNECEVLCLVNAKSPRLNNIPGHGNVKIDYCTLSEYSKYRPSNTDFDVFYHLAWDKTYGEGRDNIQGQLNNIQYTIDAVNLAKMFGCSIFIGAGSQAEYGPVEFDLTSDMSVNPESGYGIAKYSAGKFSSLLCSQLGMRHNWVRILSIYGEKDSDYTLIMYCINELLKNEKISLTKCEQIWDYLNSEDAGDALYAIGKYGKDRKNYILGSGTGLPLRTYVEKIYSLTEATCGLGFGEKEYYPHQPMHLVADISELTEDTFWHPKVSFEDGIKRIIHNIKNNMMKK